MTGRLPKCRILQLSVQSCSQLLSNAKGSTVAPKPSATASSDAIRPAPLRFMRLGHGNQWTGQNCSAATESGTHPDAKTFY